jgi:hypothetical protein
LHDDTLPLNHFNALAPLAFYIRDNRGDTPDGALFLTITKRIGEYAESQSHAFASSRLPPRLNGPAEERAINWAFKLFDEVSFDDTSIEREVMRDSITRLFTWYGAALTMDKDRCA